MPLITTYNNASHTAKAEIWEDDFSYTFVVEMFDGYFQHMGKEYNAIIKKKRVNTMEEARDIADRWIEDRS